MKTKKLFLMAAMLLMSVCSFAQNNTPPLSGDVNNDGKVNVADIVAVIKIGGGTVVVEAIAAILNIMKNAGGGVGETTYYWYAGDILPTESNLESIGNSLSSKPTTWTADNPQSIAATNNTGGSSYLYYCFPTDWNVTVLDSDKTSEVSLPSVSTFVFNGVSYTVLRTGRTISNGTTKNYWAKI